MSLTAGHWRYLEYIGGKYSLSLFLSHPHPTLLNHLYLYLVSFFSCLLTTCQLYPSHFSSETRKHRFSDYIFSFSRGLAACTEIG